MIEKQTGGSKLLPVTEEIIASLGIQSVENWKKESTPTADMF